MKTTDADAVAFASAVDNSQGDVNAPLVVEGLLLKAGNLCDALSLIKAANDHDGYVQWFPSVDFIDKKETVNVLNGFKEPRGSVTFPLIDCGK